MKSIIIRTKSLICAAVFAAFCMVSPSRFIDVSAQETAETAPIRSDTVLPLPPEPFQGKIGLTYEDSEAVKPQLKIPATFGIKDPPNILIVLIDDCGYGQMGTFGGGIPTPTMDRIANSEEKQCMI
jgi:hypothetical protein